MSAQLTISGIGRALACPAAYALPSVEGPSSEWGAQGIAVHKYLELIADGEPREEALEHTEIQPARALCDLIDTRQVPRGGETELAMAMDVTTGKCRRLKTAGHRKYLDLTSADVAGTADLVLFEKDLVTITDWKTRWHGFEPEDEKPQLEAYAVMAARIHGVEQATCRIGVITEDGAIAWHSWDLSWEDLATAVKRVQVAHVSVAATRWKRNEYEETHAAAWTPDLVTGEHCRFCPAFAHCPAKQAAVRSCLRDVPETSPMSALDAGKAWTVAKEAEECIEYLKLTVREMVESHGPLPTGDGRVVKFDSRRALRIARR